MAECNKTEKIIYKMLDICTSVPVNNIRALTEYSSGFAI